MKRRFVSFFSKLPKRKIAEISCIFSTIMSHKLLDWTFRCTFATNACPIEMLRPESPLDAA